MIISRTPFRVSLAGGGSDFAEYYRQTPGHVVSMAMTRYMYVTANHRFDDSIRVSYTRTEIVDAVEDLQHDLIREAMKVTRLTRGIEITTIADLPAGIGLGSSSTLTVGVLNALYALKGEWRSPADLARQACEIEIDILGKPIGKQDQYIAAFGGLQDVHFMPDGSVTVHPVVCSQVTRRQVVGRLLLFYTGVRREAGSVLGEARQRIEERPETRAAVDGLVALAAEVRLALVSGRVERLGGILDDGFRLKKQMASNVSNSELDAIYETARRTGAEGGKILGAGAGGCLLLYAKRFRHDEIRAAMSQAGLREIPLELEPEGSRIIHYSDDAYPGERRNGRKGNGSATQPHVKAERPREAFGLI